MTHTMDRAAVAAAIGYSEKHVARLVADGKLTEVHGQLQGRGPRRALYDPAEVARIAAAGTLAPPVALLAADQTPARNGNGHHAPPPPAGTELAPRASADQVLAWLDDLVRAASEHVSRMSRTTSTSYVSKAEALAIAGVSYAELRKAVQAGEVKQRGRRYRRKDLEGEF